jgi:hypothetical protein
MKMTSKDLNKILAVAWFFLFWWSISNNFNFSPELTRFEAFVVLFIWIGIPILIWFKKEAKGE